MLAVPASAGTVKLPSRQNESEGHPTFAFSFFSGFSGSPQQLCNG